jgi:TP901 family phage tail tape measure protein
MADDYSVKIKLETLLADQGVRDLDKGLSDMTARGRREVKSLTESFGAFGSAVKSVLASLAAYGSIQGLKGMATDIIRVGSEFEQMMLKVRASTQATDEEFKRLNQAALKLGEETEFSASQAAQALNYLTMAGLSVDKAISALPNTMNLASAGVIGIGEAADITTGILKGMGLQVEDLERANDILVKAFTSSNQTIMDLGNAFKYVGPVAKAFNVDMETVAVLLGELANAGIKGEQAGTALRSAFLDMSKVFTAYGESAYDAEGNTRGLLEAIQILVREQATPEQVAKLFGERAVTAVTSLMSSVRADSDKLSQQISDMYDNAAGSTEKAAATIRDSFKMAVDEVTGSLETIKIELFTEAQQELKEGMKALAENIRDSKGELKEWGRNILDAAKAAISLASAMIDVAKLFKESTLGSALLNTALGMTASILGAKLLVGLRNYVLHIKEAVMAQGLLAQQQKAAAASSAALAAADRHLTAIIVQMDAALAKGTITAQAHGFQMRFLTAQYGAAAVAAGKMAAANKVAAASAGTLRTALSGLYALIGGPAGLVIIAIGAAIAAYMSWKDSIKEAENALKEQNRTLFDGVKALQQYTDQLADLIQERNKLTSEPITQESETRLTEIQEQTRRLVLAATKDESLSPEFRALGDTATLSDLQNEYKKKLDNLSKETLKIIRGAFESGFDTGAGFIDTRTIQNKIELFKRNIENVQFYGMDATGLENSLKAAQAELDTAMDTLNTELETKVKEYIKYLADLVKTEVITAAQGDNLLARFIEFNIKQPFEDANLEQYFDTGMFEKFAAGVTDYMRKAAEESKKSSDGIAADSQRVDNALALSFQKAREYSAGMTGLKFFEAADIAAQAQKAGQTLTDEVGKWQESVKKQIETIQARIKVELDPAEKSKLIQDLASLHHALQTLEKQHQAALLELRADTEAKLAVFREEELRGVELTEEEKLALYKATAKAFLEAEEAKEKSAIEAARTVQEGVIASCNAIIASYQEMAAAGLIAGQAAAAVIAAQQAMSSMAEKGMADLDSQLAEVDKRFAALKANIDGMRVSGGGGRGGGGGAGGGGGRSEADEAAELAKVAADRARWEAEQAAEAIKEAFKRGDADITAFLAQTVAARKQLYDADVQAAQSAAAQAASGSASERARAQLELDQAMAKGAKATEEAYKEVFDTILEAYNELIAQINSESEAIKLNVEMGFLSEAQGRDQMRELIEKNEPALQGMLDQMEELKQAAEEAGVKLDFTGPITQSQAALQQLKTPLNEIATKINGVIRSAITGMLTDIASGTMSLGDALRAFLLNIAQGLAEIAAQQIASSIMNFFGGAGGGIGGFISGLFGFAEGGYVRGKGSPTSDSILARLSNGEYVLNAKAVRFWGPSFLDQLNKMARFDPSFLIKGLQGYAQGGLVGDPHAMTRTVINNTQEFSRAVAASDPGKVQVDVGVRAEVDKDRLIKVLVEDPKFSKAVQKSNLREKRNLTSILGE